MSPHAWGMAAAAGAGVAVSPLLASWTAALVAGDRAAWWRSRPVSISRWATVTAVTVTMTVLATAGEPEQAAAAAQVALRAGSSEDAPLLDLAEACQARGERAQAESYIKQIMANHDAEDEEDLPPRTYEVLRRRRWLPPAA